MSTRKLPLAEPHVVIITGMSGAGRSHTAKVLEDVGYFVVDNLPPSLIAEVVERAGLGEAFRTQFAVVVDTRGGLTFEELDDALVILARRGVRTTVLFLDADDQALHRRFEEVRRPHPVPGDTLGHSIMLERTAFEDLRGQADVIVDTSDLNVHELRQRLEVAFSGERPTRRMRVNVTSFGFKRGTPRVADLMFDVRFMPNPHWHPDLRPLTGRDQQVRDYVLEQEDAKEFVDRVEDLLDFLVPKYEAEGKSYLTIGVGCTGGRHRSVAVAEELAHRLSLSKIEATVHHRDLPPDGEH